MTARPTDTRLDAIRAAVARREQAYLDLLRDLVAIDSGSLDHEGVRRITDVLEGILIAERFAVEHVPVGALHVLVGRRAGTGPTILLNAHMDTVYDRGTAAERPFEIVDGHVRGAGVADDKCGIVAALVAVQALDEVGSDADLMVVFTPDEELGSPFSAPVTARLAAEADVALCLEAGREDGSLVSARKGGANLRAQLTGRGAHSGVEPHKGINAALHMAHAIVGLEALNDFDRGTTVNVGVARAGSRSNIVPAEATMWIDLRAWTVEEYDALLAEAQRVVCAPHVDGVQVATRLEASSPPMEATPAVTALGDLACALGAELGIDGMRHVHTGGMGDANIVATAGIPVLDGLAPVGGDDHTPAEWLDAASIVPRVTLLTALIDRLAVDGVPAP